MVQASKWSTAAQSKHYAKWGKACWELAWLPDTVYLCLDTFIHPTEMKPIFRDGVSQMDFLTFSTFLTISKTELLCSKYGTGGGSPFYSVSSFYSTC